MTHKRQGVILDSTHFTKGVERVDMFSVEECPYFSTYNMLSTTQKSAWIVCSLCLQVIRECELQEQRVM